MSKTGDTAQTLSRGLDVLELLAASPTPLNPTQIAAELGLSRTIVYRLVTTLIEHGMATRSDNGAIVLGLTVLTLAENVLPSVRDLVRPMLQDLAESLGATAYFSVNDGGESLALTVVEPRNTTYHLAYRQGSRVPLDQGALGRAILAAREGNRGVFQTRGEIIEGAVGVAAAVPGLPGLAGAVGIVTLSPAPDAQVEQRVQAAADDLATLLTAQTSM